MTTTHEETLEFQAETRQLLQMMVHSIYSNKDIFLRELISNSSDALDKLRLAVFTEDVRADIDDLHIDLEIDSEQRTLTVRDNGIGMSREEVIALIGTIAKSGTAEFLKKMRESKEAAERELIGQFGVGFYSSFMVADRVVLLTRRAGEEHGTRWDSTGEGTYTLATVDDAPQGTAVTLHLKPADEDDQLHDYTADWKVKQVVQRYSDFITWPVRLVPSGKDSAEEGSEQPEPETINSMKALWARPESEVAEGEYAEFYKHVSHDWTDPLETIRVAAEGSLEYQALLFLPSRAPMDLYMRDGKRGVQLYVKRVFIMDDCEALMPEYLRFVKGVVDAQDLSLNVSREILQQDRQIQMMRKRLVKRVLSTLGTMQSEDAEKYRTFWSEFGPVVKEGLVNDPANRETILDIASFASTHDAERQTTLREYVERMPEGQEHIYYLTGRNRSVVENSPHMEGFRAKGIEVLVLTDAVDEMWAESAPAYEGKTFQSIAKGAAELDSGDEQGEASKDQQEQYAGLLSWLGTTLGEDLKEARLTTRLTTSPACLVADEGDMTPELERLYRAMGQEVPKTKRILELNPEHALVRGLREAHAARGEDAGVAETAELLYGMALLAEGGELDDAARFTRLLSDRLAGSL